MFCIGSLVLATVFKALRSRHLSNRTSSARTSPAAPPQPVAPVAPAPLEVPQLDISASESGGSPLSAPLSQTSPPPEKLPHSAISPESKGDCHGTHASAEQSE